MINISFQSTSIATVSFDSGKPSNLLSFSQMRSLTKVANDLKSNKKLAGNRDFVGSEGPGRDPEASRSPHRDSGVVVPQFVGAVRSS